MNGHYMLHYIFYLIKPIAQITRKLIWLPVYIVLIILC